jgi:hypothetical protein
MYKVVENFKGLVLGLKITVCARENLNTQLN